MAKTAAELMKELNNDPAYQMAIAAKERERRAAINVLVEDQRTLIEELSQVGVNVRTISDLVNTSASYPAAVPVLLKHLEIPHQKEIRECIVRALAVKEARGIATEPLLKLFSRLDDSESDTKWVVALAIGVTATTDHLAQVITLCENRRHGYARGPLLHALKNLDKSTACAILQKFAEDTEVQADYAEVVAAISGRKA